jgi:hypothetical protein
VWVTAKEQPRKALAKPREDAEGVGFWVGDNTGWFFIRSARRIRDQVIVFIPLQMAIGMPFGISCGADTWSFVGKLKSRSYLVK